MKVKSAIQALSMLSSLALAMAVAGCTEETPPPVANTPPAVVAPKTEKAVPPPVTTPKTEEKK